MPLEREQSCRIPRGRQTQAYLSLERNEPYARQRRFESGVFLTSTGPLQEANQVGPNEKQMRNG